MMYSPIQLGQILLGDSVPMAFLTVSLSGELLLLAGKSMANMMLYRFAEFSKGLQATHCAQDNWHKIEVDFQADKHTAWQFAAV